MTGRKTSINMVGVTRTYTENEKFIDEFIESGDDCWEIKEYTHNSADSCASAINASIKRYGHVNVKCCTRKGIPYIYRTDRIKK